MKAIYAITDFIEPRPKKPSYSISEHTHDFINSRTMADPDVIKPYIEYLRGRYQRSHFPTYLKYPSPSI